MKLDQATMQEYEHLTAVSRFLNKGSSEQKISEFLTKVHVVPEDLTEDEMLVGGEFEAVYFSVHLFELKALELLAPIYGTKNATVRDYYNTKPINILIDSKWLVNIHPSKTTASLNFRLVNMELSGDEYLDSDVDIMIPFSIHHLPTVKAILDIYFEKHEHGTSS